MGEAIWYPGMTLEDMVEATIKKAFKHYGNNKTHTAKALGISIRNLDSKIKEYQEKELFKANKLAPQLGVANGT